MAPDTATGIKNLWKKNPFLSDCDCISSTTASPFWDLGTGIKQQGFPEFYEIVFKWNATETSLRTLETWFLQRQEVWVGDSECSHCSVFLTGLWSFSCWDTKPALCIVIKFTCYDGSPNSPTNIWPCPFLFQRKNLIPGQITFDAMLCVEGRSLRIKAWVTARPLDGLLQGGIPWKGSPPWRHFALVLWCPSGELAKSLSLGAGGSQKLCHSWSRSTDIWHEMLE